MAEEPLTKNTETEATINLTNKLQVVPNWRKVIRTYSFWISISSAVLTMVGVILPFMGFLQPVLSMEHYAWAMFTLSSSAALARVIKQQKFWVGDVPKELLDDKSSE